MRLTRKVFSDLAIYMIGFGLVIGIVFPLFVKAAGVPEEYVRKPLFIILCIIAGILVGTVNVIITRQVVGRRLRLLADRMKFVDSKIISGLTSTELAECTEESCKISVDSDDEIGESAQAFNDLVNTLANSMRNEHAIKAFNEMLASKLELDQLSENALVQILAFMQAEAGAIFFEQGGELHLAAAMNITKPETLLTDSSIWQVVKTKQRKLLNLSLQVQVNTPLVSFTPAQTLIEPLIYEHLVIGVIIIASSNRFLSESMYGFEMFARGVALALRNAITYDQLQKLAANDPLTNLYNRRFGMIRFTEEFTRAVRSTLPLGIIMFDIDHFKSFNDTYGHIVGDKVLVTIARIARMAIREGDFLIRYGGEEFMAVLPGAAYSDTQFVAERLRHMIEDCSVQHNSQTLHVTISAGYTSYPENEVSDEQLFIHNADNALYTAKGSGRNCIQGYEK